jgi:hypothetical protein
MRDLKSRALVHSGADDAYLYDVSTDRDDGVRVPCAGLHEIGNDPTDAETRYQGDRLGMAMGIHSSLYCHAAAWTRYWPIEALAVATLMDAARVRVTVCEHATLLQLDAYGPVRAVPNMLIRHHMTSCPERLRAKAGNLLFFDKSGRPIDVEEYVAFEQRMREELRDPCARPWAVWTENPFYWPAQRIRKIRQSGNSQAGASTSQSSVAR